MSTTTHLTILTGASRGMGLAIAQALLQPGQLLLGISRTVNADLAAEAEAAGATLLQWPMDLCDAAPVADALEAWLKQQKSDHFASATLINNACIVSPPGPLESNSSADLLRAVRVGLEAVLVLSAAFLRATAGWSGERRVLNISSGLGRRPMAGSAAYCAVKAGMDHASRVMSLEQAALVSQGRNGAKIVSLAPGVIDTDMQLTLRSADAASFPERERFVQLKAQGQLDSPAQAAAKVLAYLARPDFGANAVADIRD